MLIAELWDGEVLKHKGEREYGLDRRKLDAPDLIIEFQQTCLQDLDDVVRKMSDLMDRLEETIERLHYRYRIDLKL